MRLALAAIAGMALAVGGCSSGSDDGVRHAPASVTGSASTTNPAGALAKMLLPSTDYATVAHDGSLRATGLSAGDVDVGYWFDTNGAPAGPAMIQFPVFENAVECISRVTLRVRISAPAELAVPAAVYPANPDAIAAREGQMLPRWELLLDNRPRGVISLRNGEGEADVTQLVLTWMRGGLFPASGRGVPLRTPLALAVLPENGTSPATFHLLMSESGPSGSPTLVVAAHC